MNWHVLLEDPWRTLILCGLGLLASAVRERTRESHPWLSSKLAFAVRILPAAMVGASKHLAPTKPETPVPGSIEEYVLKMATDLGKPAVATVEDRPTTPEKKETP